MPSRAALAPYAGAALAAPLGGYSSFFALLAIVSLTAAPWTKPQAANEKAR